MTMHGDFSPEARARAGKTVDAANVFADHAEHIVGELVELPDGHVLVAVVDEGHAFSGTHHVAQDQIVEKVPQLEGEGGWAMVFTPGANADDIRRRTDEMAKIAAKRREMIGRILARKNNAT
jgi:hypothetical protein